jgi:hypothetical protein
MNLPASILSAYTFGSPRVGNSAFCRRYDELVPCTFRIVNCKDVVTKVLSHGFLPLPIRVADVRQESERRDCYNYLTLNSSFESTFQPIRISVVLVLYAYAGGVHVGGAQVPWGMLGYRHVGRMVLLDSLDNILIEPTWVEVATSHTIPQGSVAAHLLANYRGAMEACIAKEHAGSWRLPLWTFPKDKANLDEDH